MSGVTAQMIKELRDRTGVGMSKCKKALEETSGNMEEAISNLRKSGMASAVKKAERTTNEGMIGTSESNEHIAIVEVNAETDFVVKNDRFQEFLKNIVEEVGATGPESLESFLKQPWSQDSNLSIDEYRATMVQTIGENIQIRRLKTFRKDGNTTIGVYSHMGGKIVTVVELSGSDSEADLARDIAMHVAAAAPDFLSPETVPEDVIAHEKEIAKTQMAGKPENIIDKIIAGKLNAFFDDACLLRQKFIKDDSQSVSDVISRRAKESGKDLAIAAFTRWSVGQ